MRHNLRTSRQNTPNLALKTHLQLSFLHAPAAFASQLTHISSKYFKPCSKNTPAIEIPARPSVALHAWSPVIELSPVHDLNVCVFVCVYCMCLCVCVCVCVCVRVRVCVQGDYVCCVLYVHASNTSFTEELRCMRVSASM